MTSIIKHCIIYYTSKIISKESFELKTFNKFKVILIMALVCITLLSCNSELPSGSYTEQTTSPDTETAATDTAATDTTVPVTDTATPTTNTAEPDNTTVIPSEPQLSDLRVLITSDIHCTDLQEWYGTNYRTRMQHWVDSILKEHKENPFDLIVINGDISLDYWIHGGSVITKGKGTSKIFVDEYLSQLPDDLPYFILPGNHEQYSDSEWFEITGNHRSGYMEVGGRLFIFLDNFAGNLDPKENHDGVYTKTDVKYINDLMEKYPQRDVFLIAHHFDASAESSEFKKLVKENDRIKGLFSGHTHKTAVIELGADWGNKTLAQTGNFAYFKDSAKESFWGFRELIVTEKDCYSQYIITESEATVDGVKQKFKRTALAQVCYYGTAPELPKEEDPFASYNKLYDKINQASIDGDVGMKESNRVQLIFDEQVNTKWCVRPTSSDGSVTVTWEMTESVRIDAYAISTANDHLSRNPDAWTIYGRNSESDEWTIISDVKGGNLPNELFTVSDIFTIDNPTAYKYYKMTITENFNNRDLYQFSELILLQK